MLRASVFGSGFNAPRRRDCAGAYIDRIGRVGLMMVTLAIMGCGTLLIALVPGKRSARQRLHCSAAGPVNIRISAAALS